MPNSSPLVSTEVLKSPPPLIHWTEADQACSALWRSERGAAPPKRIVLADDTTTADIAYRFACEGTALLWRGDFQNARQLLQALARRADNIPTRKRKKAAQEVPLAEAFHLHRLAQSQRARMLGMLLIPFNADYSIPLRRAPDAKAACAEAWGAADAATGASVASLRELLGITSAHEWRRVGVEIAALGDAPNNRIHPHYGVFSPVRGEYIHLVATAHLPKPPTGQASIVAFDIGTGTGVLSAVLARRGVQQVVATDQDPRALACARDNLARLGVAQQVKVVQADLFPEGRASLVVCNPPWLPARPSSPLEHAVYDEGSRMLLGFLKGLTAHLAPKGEGWLILSNFAEHLGLRSRAELLAAFESNGLRVVSRIDARPQHPKASDANDPLHEPRSREVTSLWRLAAI
ncbi:class I SAM-dependent methyltransferase [Rhodoferax sp. UBA5149]|uniref:class I SAM-dependent methyltransferase n=1 Tax=Rhodoferax sp. UBA5149 TaxID=1947379 RepID=UPI0025EE8DAE|nr:class I SAM-dependent methyltransferase [Rhodoferax sp. UBA5149]